MNIIQHVEAQSRILGLQLVIASYQAELAYLEAQVGSTQTVAPKPVVPRPQKGARWAPRSGRPVRLAGKVMDAVRTVAGTGDAFTLSQVRDQTGVLYQSAAVALRKLVDAGEIVKVAHGLYRSAA